MSVRPWWEAVLEQLMYPSEQSSGPGGGGGGVSSANLGSVAKAAAVITPKEKLVDIPKVGRCRLTLANPR